MDSVTRNLEKEELIPLELRALYERRGYKKYTMGRFEPYDIYTQNRNFLQNEGIITFTDARGRLMALKPDVTMSIVKNSSCRGESEKYYYCENVFRVDASRECKEIRQMGLEYIGGQGIYCEAEVLSLALESLAAISGEYVLDISHMGFVQHVLSNCGLRDECVGEAMAALEQKSPHLLEKVARGAGLSEQKLGVLLELAALSGDFAKTLERAKGIACDGESEDALRELEVLYSTLGVLGSTEHVRLDFSLMNDIGYYNGIIFRGYISGVPKAVLTGGRYDLLMERFGKDTTALGFALYLGELDRALHIQQQYDADALLVQNGADSLATARAAKQLMDSYESVRVEQSADTSLRARHIFEIDKNGELREKKNA